MKKQIQSTNRTMPSRWCRGQTMTEYALILGAIAVVCILAYDSMGTTVVGLLNNVNTLL